MSNPAPTPATPLSPDFTAIITAALLSIPIAPLFAYGHSALALGIGSFLMQFLVQGAWGVIPAHLSELSPNSIRGFLPGFAYQCGVLLSGSVAVVEATLAEHMSYSSTMAITAGVVFAGASIVMSLGRENRAHVFGVTTAPEPAPVKV